MFQDESVEIINRERNIFLHLRKSFSISCLSGNVIVNIHDHISFQDCYVFLKTKIPNSLAKVENDKIPHENLKNIHDLGTRPRTTLCGEDVGGPCRLHPSACTHPLGVALVWASVSETSEMCFRC